MKYVLSNVQRFKTAIDKLVVQSYEMNVYLVELHINGESGLVFDDKNNLLRFNSTQAIREAFEDCKVKEACMQHDSPYDEMIGNPPKSSDRLPLPFSMTQPY